MFDSLFIIYLLINIVYTEHNNQCLLLNNKLNKYNIYINNQEKKDFIGLKLCQNLIHDYCCPQIYEDKIQNATAIELYNLFELYSINLYEPLIRLNLQLNDTIINLIELSRNETHFILENNYKTFYNSYRLSIDLFYNNLLKLSYKTYHHNIKNFIEELFYNILHITIQLNNDNKPISSSYLSCLWKHHPFGNRPNLILNKLEINLEKLFHLNELFKLSIELVQIMSTSVTTDYHCIDSYMQLSYCNLCSGQKELPCLSNCINIIESCLVNVSLINDIWINFIDSLENVVYFNGIQNAFSSIGTSISDALITFFNSDGIENKDIINQCGHIHLRKEIFDNDQKISDKYSNSLSTLLDKQLMSIRQSLQIYRSFWLMLPKEICKSNEISATNEKICWTGTSISQDSKQTIRINYDKPLSLRLQWILKEITEKSQIIGYKQQTTTDLYKNSSSTIKNLFLIDELKLNLTNDYPNDNGVDYSDYLYEDSIEESTSTTSSTTIQLSSSSIFDDISVDDVNTVSYYDYGEQDVYIDNELDETSTQQTSSIPTTTIVRIPSYHQRQPIIWNINIDDDFDQQIKHNSSSFFNYSFLLLLLLLIFILT